MSVYITHTENLFKDSIIRYNKPKEIYSLSLESIPEETEEYSVETDYIFTSINDYNLTENIKTKN